MSVPLLAALALVALGWALWGIRSPVPPAPRVLPEAPQRRRAGLWLAVSVLAHVPALQAALPPAAARAYAPGDLGTHARVVRELAEGALRDGWIDGWQGGFPLGPHYPSLGWMVALPLVEAGIAPSAALRACLLAASVVASALLGVALERGGAGRLGAAAGALALAWVSPINVFVGGINVGLQLGLYSQAIALPLVVLLGVALTPVVRSVALAPIAAALLALAHPQIALPTSIVIAAAAFVSATRRAITRALLAGAASAVVLAACYGPGLTRLTPPFGWPEMDPWRKLGFPPSLWWQWAREGEVLDAGRPPILSALTLLALLTHGFRWRSAFARAVLAALLVAAVLASSGGLLQARAPALLAFVQPLRAAALLPPIVAVLVGLAAGIWSADFAARLAGAPLRWRVVAGAGAVLTGCLTLGATSGPLVEQARARAAALTGVTEQTPCGGDVRTAFGPQAAFAELAALAGGRVFFDVESRELAVCQMFQGWAVAPRVAITPAGGVGAHVGLHSAAFSAIAPRDAGAEQRADALGVRFLLSERSRLPEPGEAWKLRQDFGELRLLERRAPTSLIGVGCLAGTLRGNASALLARGFADLRDPIARARWLDPQRFLALEIAPGAVTELPPPPCAPARLLEAESARGHHRARVAAEGEVVVVLRSTFSDAWRVELDGRAVEAMNLAPGFLGVRVPAGEHRVEARVGWTPGYLAGVVVAAGFVALLSAAPSLSARFRRSPSPAPRR